MTTKSPPLNWFSSRPLPFRRTSGAAGPGQRLELRRPKSRFGYTSQACYREKDETGPVKAPFLRFVNIAFFFLLSLFVLSGCATGPPPQQTYGDFLMVEVQADDNLSTLAAKYLADSSKDWVIADLNGVTSVEPGQLIIIPWLVWVPGNLKNA